MEIWKDLNGYEDNYSISNLGNIMSKERQVPTKNPEILRTIKAQKRKKFINKRGYEIVTLSKNNKIKTFTVHQLMALSFFKDFDKGTQINHIDGNKINNELSNLEVSNSSHNQFHAVREGLVKPRGKSKYRYVYYVKNPRAVNRWAGCIVHNGKNSYGWKTFPTELEAAKYVDELLDSINDTNRLRNFP